MVEPTYLEGIKPPKGALVKSQGIDRLGSDQLRIGQVRIKEMNVSEPLCDVEKLPHPVKSYDVRDGVEVQ